MNRFRNKALTPNSQSLRKSMTKEECHLWYDFLRHLPVQVKRQKAIGSYIVDFYIPRAKLVIELDGSQHYEKCGLAADAERDAALARMGLRVLRYSNADVMLRFPSVCEDIHNQIEKRVVAEQKPSP